MTQEELNQKLINACNDNDLESAEDLIEQGAEVNVKDDYEWTPLHYACFYKNLELVRFLIENGADINAKNDEGHIPLDYAEHLRFLQAI